MPDCGPCVSSFAFLSFLYTNTPLLSLLPFSRSSSFPLSLLQAIKEALEGFDPIKDRLIPFDDEDKGGTAGGRPPFSIPRFPPIVRPGGGGSEGGGGDDVIGDVNEILGTVTGGLWPSGEQVREGGRKGGRVGSGGEGGREGGRPTFEYLLSRSSPHTEKGHAP